MNKRNIITVAVCLVAVCLVLVVKCHPRTLPIEECSQVYKDYADDPHVAVAFIKDFPVNDTLRVDVTTLRALEEGIQDFGGCAVVVSHDRWFLDRIATHILAFEDDGTVTWFEGNFEGYHEQRRRLLGDAADQPKRIRFRPI